MLYALKAINNTNNQNYYTSEIRNIVSKYKTDKLTLLWIPGHCGKKGNDLADTTANKEERYSRVPRLSDTRYLKGYGDMQAAKRD